MNYITGSLATFIARQRNKDDSDPSVTVHHDRKVGARRPYLAPLRARPDLAGLARQAAQVRRYGCFSGPTRPVSKANTAA